VLSRPVAPRYLPSFPTRRSSDLTPPAAAGAVLWAVNFNGPVRQHPVRDITRLVLRHTYGTVKSVASDGQSLTITKDFPVMVSDRSEEHTSELQSHLNLVCRLLLE